MPLLLLATIAAAIVNTAPARACDVGDTTFAIAWNAGLRCEHPLCGHGRWLTAPAGAQRCEIANEVFGEVSRVLRAGGIAAIGEVHDNGRQHGLRAELLSEAVRVWQAKPGAVFEHIRADQQNGLDEFKSFSAKARRLGNTGDLFRFLDWDKSGWPDKALFQPIFDETIRHKLPIYAGDPARADIKRVAKEGETALPEAERQRLWLDEPFPAPAQEALLDDLEKSHCGLMPKSAFGKLAYAQRYRDAYLADVLLKAAKENGSAILFAGNGHVRADRGVPYYLRQRAGDKIVSVMLVEVEDGKDKPEDYEIKSADGKPLADFVIFTPRAERPDPCEEMKKQFGAKAAPAAPAATAPAAAQTAPAADPKAADQKPVQ